MCGGGGEWGVGGQRAVCLADGPGCTEVAVEVPLPEIASDPVARGRIVERASPTRHLPLAAVVRLLEARLWRSPSEVPPRIAVVLACRAHLSCSPVVPGLGAGSL
jgi:hypothetical protein